MSRHKVASRASATAGRCQHLAGKTSNAKGSTLQYFSIPRITTLADRRHRHPAVLSGLSRLTACPADAFLPSRCRLWAGGSGFRPLLFLHTSRRLLLHLPVPRHARFRLSPQLRVWLVARSGKQMRRSQTESHKGRRDGGRRTETHTLRGCQRGLTHRRAAPSPRLEQLLALHSPARLVEGCHGGSPVRPAHRRGTSKGREQKEQCRASVASASHNRRRGTRVLRSTENFPAR